MKKFISLGTALATGLVSVAGIVSCGPNNKTPKKPEGGTTTGGTGTTTGGTGTTTGGTGTTTGGTGTTTGGTGTTTGGTGTTTGGTGTTTGGTGTKTGGTGTKTGGTGTKTGGTGTKTGGTGTKTGGTGTKTGGTGTKTGGTGTTTGGTGTKDVRKKVIWHLQSYYNGNVIKGVTFSPATFELPKNISVKDFVRRIHEFGTRNGKEGWWYKSAWGDAITVYTITLGDLTITASFDGKKIKTGGKEGDGPARNTHYTLFDKGNNAYTTVAEISKKLGVDPNGTETTGGGGTVVDPDKGGVVVNPDKGGGKVIPKKVGKITYQSSNYYNGAEGLKGEALFDKLYNGQQGHLGGTRGYGGLYSTYKKAFADTMYEKDGTILDVYSENPSGKDPYNFTHGNNKCGNYGREGDCYNREHVIPQSKFGKAKPMHDDAQMVWPTDGKVNGMRSNYPHGIVDNVEKTSKNGSKLGTGKYGEKIFEPIDEFKGDFARAYFYFQLTYHGRGQFSPFKDSFPYFTNIYLKTYIKWAKEDPVDAFDIQRNDEIAKIQGNRNPFCDYPGLVDSIWGSGDAFVNNGAATSIDPV